MKDVEVYQLPNGKWDIKLTDGKSTFVEDGAQAIQHCIMRLNKFEGDSVTDNPNEEYTDLYGIIFNMKKSKLEKELHLKKRILGTPGIRSILFFKWTQEQRAVTVNCTVLDDWGGRHIFDSTLEA